MLKILTNKHLIIALIVSPILAIMAYYAVDYTVSEKPHKAIEGEAYPLVAKSNCRYTSGKCTFENGDIEVSVVVSSNNDNDIGVAEKQVWAVTLDANVPLRGAKIAFINDTAAPEGTSNTPHDMFSLNPALTQWQANISDTHIEGSQLQLAIAINNTYYYGESDTQFIHYAVGFPSSH